MPVPRLRDTLDVCRIDADDGPLFSVRERDGTEVFRLTEGGWELLRRLDGVAEEDEVLRSYAAAGGEMDLEGLREFCDSLRSAGVLAEENSVPWLTYLREQGVGYRGPRPDRRRAVHPEAGADDDPRAGDRRRESARTARFDVGIAHLNDGRLDQAAELFSALSEEDPGDVRVAELLGHLSFLQARAEHPGLERDRRDASWDAFDRALGRLLEAGCCPACDADLTVELYRPNRCDACGNSFTATVLARTLEERRGS